eukprot:scaffold59617_cov79-Phaeocystis_antarctica.AAC.5
MGSRVFPSGASIDSLSTYQAMAARRARPNLRPCSVRSVLVSFGAPFVTVLKPPLIREALQCPPRLRLPALAPTTIAGSGGKCNQTQVIST